MKIMPRIAAVLALTAALCTLPRTASPEASRSASAPASVSPAALTLPAQKLPDDIVLPAYKPGTLPFHPGQRLKYQASWVGIPAASAEVQLARDRQDPALLLAQVSVKTNHAVDVLFKMRDSMVEQVDHQTLAPQHMYIRQSENKRLNDYNVSFDHHDGVVTMVKSNRRGKQVRKFISPEPWGPLSGSIMALSQPLAVGERYVFDVFTGTTRYVFAFKVTGRDRITTALGTFDALRLVPSVLYDSSGKLKQSATALTIWVTADDHHLPLRAEAQAFVGWVRADLVSVSG